ncbi:MAG: hypothetical protein U0744_17380 [Gemmataceae bacterium]
MKRYQELQAVYSTRNVAGFVALLLASPTHAGIYIATETFADLPSQWRGFLPRSPHRGTSRLPRQTRRMRRRFAKYEQDAKVLREAERTAEEQADSAGCRFGLAESMMVSGAAAAA